MIVLVGIIMVVVVYIIIKSGVQLEIEFNELELMHTYNFLVIYKKYLTGKEDIKLSCEVTDDIGYLFNPFNFKTLLTRAEKRYIIQYFKDNYYVLDGTKKKCPEQTASIERIRMVMDKWI